MLCGGFSAETRRDTMTKAADQEYITTAIGKKYRVEKSSDFEYVTTAIGEECFLFGVDVFAHEWTDTRKCIRVHDPLYGQPYTMNVYEITVDGTVHRFAAGEFSNNVWGFWLPTNRARPDGHNSARIPPAESAPPTKAKDQEEIEPRELIRPAEISKRTLQMMDESIRNLNAGKVSEPIELSEI